MKRILVTIGFGLMLIAGCKQYDQYGNEISCDCVSGHSESELVLVTMPDGNGNLTLQNQWQNRYVCDQTECHIVKYADTSKR